MKLKVGLVLLLLLVFSAAAYAQETASAAESADKLRAQLLEVKASPGYPLTLITIFPK